MKKGLFITFEGADGSGKTTQLNNIKSFLEEKGEAFYNNIIVALPDTVAFKDGAGHYKNIDQISALEGNCKLILPKEMNSICVIDGQHRIYAHYRELLM